MLDEGGSLLSHVVKSKLTAAEGHETGRRRDHLVVVGDEGDRACEGVAGEASAGHGCLREELVEYPN